MSYGRKRRIGCVGVKVPTIACDFLSCERERKSFQLWMHSTLVHWDSPAK